MTVLHQIIAVEKTVKSRAQTAITEIHKANKHPALFEGASKTYQPKDNAGDQIPTEKQLVQRKSRDVLKSITKIMTDLFDTTATKDYANTQAKADITVNGVVIVQGAPVPFLLFLEKQLVDVRTMIDCMPTLDPAQVWTKDENDHLFRTEPTQSNRTKKVEKFVVVVQPTKEHPAQSAKVTEDEVIGTYTTTRLSGALPIPRKEILLDRVDALLRAVKNAREEANGTQAPEKKVGEQIFGFLFAE